MYNQFSVEVCGPVDQVETAKEHRKHDPGHAVDFAHTVEGLLVLLWFGLWFGLVGGSTFGYSGQPCVLGNIWTIVCHSNCKCIVLLRDRCLFFL